MEVDSLTEIGLEGKGERRQRGNRLDNLQTIGLEEKRDVGWARWGGLITVRARQVPYLKARGTSFFDDRAPSIITWLNCYSWLAKHTHTHKYTHFLDSFIRIFIICRATTDPGFANQALCSKQAHQHAPTRREGNSLLHLIALNGPKVSRSHRAPNQVLQ